jgi:hypothetical protein
MLALLLEHLRGDDLTHGVLLQVGGALKPSERLLVETDDVVILAAVVAYGYCH